MKKVLSVVGARPNYMKIAPIHRAFKKYKNEIIHFICHTGQHYDQKMFKIFFEDLELPEPDFYLNVGSGSHAEQTGNIMIEFEKVLLAEKPDLVIVVGDVNSTIACSLTASKLHIPIAHVEAGLRSFDKTMPEEINRILTDAMADYLFVTERSGLTNLKNERVSENKVFFVGNTMIDSLINFLPKTKSSKILPELNLEPQNFILITFHRSSNVDDKNNLSSLVNLLNNLSEYRKVIFPIHPRTRKNLERYELLALIRSNVILTDPVGYIDFITLIKNAILILTDSGGIQEESTFLGIQCITIRNSTERPVTVKIGTNHLAGTEYQNAKQIAIDILNGNIKPGNKPELWDGKTGERISEIIETNIL